MALRGRTGCCRLTWSMSCGTGFGTGRVFGLRRTGFGTGGMFSLRRPGLGAPASVRCLHVRFGVRPAG